MPLNLNIFIQVFESVMAYVIKNEEDILPMTIFRILRCFYHVGYDPPKREDFFKVCCKILER